MKIDLAKMAEATRLVRSGQLRAATTLIQSALRGHEPADVPPPASPRAPDDDAIEVPARVVDSEAAPAAAHAIVGEARTPGPADGVAPQAAPTPRAAPEAPSPHLHEAAASFIAGSFTNGHDRRDYKLFVPAQAGGAPLPLVVMLHGCTQNPDDFAAGTGMNEVAAAHGFYVLYPAQSRQANPQGCWNWFKHSHQQRERGEPALLAGMTREVMAQHRIDPRRVYVAGLSAGGAMAAILGQTHPELYAAVGVHSGLAAGSARDLPSALMAMRSGSAGSPGAPSERPTIVFHGDADGTVHLRNGEHVIAACVPGAGSVEVQAVEGAGVHKATRAIHRAADGRIVAEHWTVHGAAHAWSGGRAAGSYTDARGPDASAQMLRFFLEHPLAGPAVTSCCATRAA